MKEYLPIAQIVVSFLLIFFILLQQRGTALGPIFGSAGGSWISKRGLEKKVFWSTIFFAILFLGLALLNLLV